MIKRYSISYDSKEENHAGDWCAASDVAALEARCATLIAEVMHYTAGTPHPLEAWCRELERCLDGGVDCANERISLKAALREAIEYVTLDSEYPLEMVNRWERAFTPETKACGTCGDDSCDGRHEDLR